MIIAALLLLVAQANSFAMPYRPQDPRIQRVPYDPDQVVPLAVGKGYAAVIDLGPDQQVETVVVGNSTGWEVTASKRGDHVIVKPIEGATSTDMIVITADRRYVFMIQPAEGASSFVLSFGAPERLPVQLAATAPASTSGVDFKLRGDKALYPSAMRSDGQRTFITWGKSIPLPAIFAIESDHEAIVNGRMMGNDFVIEGMAQRYVFRLGKKYASATRRKTKRVPQQ